MKVMVLNLIFKNRKEKWIKHQPKYNNFFEMLS